MGDLYAELRKYQELIVTQAKEKNTIAYLPTGTGKTLIACYLIRHRIESVRIAREQKNGWGKIIVFIAPTRALLHQQIVYIRKHVFPIKAQEFHRESTFMGKSIDQWEKEDWQYFIQRFELFGMIPESLRRLVEKNIIPVEIIDLIIFDECHHVIGNSAMASLCDAINQNQNCKPLILGMTASPIQSKQAKTQATIEDVISNLENRLNAHFFYPTEEFLQSLQFFIKKPKLYLIEYKDTFPSLQEVLFHSLLERLEKSIILKEIITQEEQIKYDLNYTSFICFEQILKSCNIPSKDLISIHSQPYINEIKDSIYKTIEIIKSSGIYCGFLAFQFLMNSKLSCNSHENETILNSLNESLSLKQQDIFQILFSEGNSSTSSSTLATNNEHHLLHKSISIDGLKKKIDQMIQYLKNDANKLHLLLNQPYCLFTSVMELLYTMGLFSGLSNCEKVLEKLQEKKKLSMSIITSDVMKDDDATDMMDVEMKEKDILSSSNDKLESINLMIFLLENGKLRTPFTKLLPTILQFPYQQIDYFSVVQLVCSYFLESISIDGVMDKFLLNYIPLFHSSSTSDEQAISSQLKTEFIQNFLLPNKQKENQNPFLFTQKFDSLMDTLATTTLSPDNFPLQQKNPIPFQIGHILPERNQLEYEILKDINLFYEEIKESFLSTYSASSTKNPQELNTQGSSSSSPPPKPLASMGAILVFCSMRILSSVFHYFFEEMRKRWEDYLTRRIHSFETWKQQKLQSMIINSNDNQIEFNFLSSYSFEFIKLFPFPLQSESLVGSSTIEKQKNVLTNLKLSKFHLLFTTDVAQEGLDITQCNIILNYDNPKTLIGFIQRRGRARSKSSLLIHFVKSFQKKYYDQETKDIFAFIQQEIDTNHLLKSMYNEIYSETLYEMKQFALNERIFMPSTGLSLDFRSGKLLLESYCNALLISLWTILFKKLPEHWKQPSSTSSSSSSSSSALSIQWKEIFILNCQNLSNALGGSTGGGVGGGNNSAAANTSNSNVTGNNNFLSSMMGNLPTYMINFPRYFLEKIDRSTWKSLLILPDILRHLFPDCPKYFTIETNSKYKAKGLVALKAIEYLIKKNEINESFRFQYLNQKRISTFYTKIQRQIQLYQLLLKNQQQQQSSDASSSSSQVNMTNKAMNAYVYSTIFQELENLSSEKEGIIHPLLLVRLQSLSSSLPTSVSTADEINKEQDEQEKNSIFLYAHRISRVSLENSENGLDVEVYGSHLFEDIPMDICVKSVCDDMVSRDYFLPSNQYSSSTLLLQHRRRRIPTVKLQEFYLSSKESFDHNQDQDQDQYPRNVLMKENSVFSSSFHHEMEKNEKDFSSHQNEKTTMISTTEMMEETNSSHQLPQEETTRINSANSFPFYCYHFEILGKEKYYHQLANHTKLLSQLQAIEQTMILLPFPISESILFNSIHNCFPFYLKAFIQNPDHQDFFSLQFLGLKYFSLEEISLIQLFHKSIIGLQPFLFENHSEFSSFFNENNNGEGGEGVEGNNNNQQTNKRVPFFPLNYLPLDEYLRRFYQEKFPKKNYSFYSSKPEEKDDSNDHDNDDADDDEEKLFFNFDEWKSITNDAYYLLCALPSIPNLTDFLSTSTGNNHHHHHLPHRHPVYSSIDISISYQELLEKEYQHPILSQLSFEYLLSMAKEAILLINNLFIMQKNNFATIGTSYCYPNQRKEDLINRLATTTGNNLVCFENTELLLSEDEMFQYLQEEQEEKEKEKERELFGAEGEVGNNPKKLKKRKKLTDPVQSNTSSGSNSRRKRKLALQNMEKQSQLTRMNDQERSVMSTTTTTTSSASSFHFDDSDDFSFAKFWMNKSSAIECFIKDLLSKANYNPPFTSHYLLLYKAYPFSGKLTLSNTSIILDHLPTANESGKLHPGKRAVSGSNQGGGDISLSTEIFLLPQLVQPIGNLLFYQMMNLIPSIMYRLQSILLANELFEDVFIPIYRHISTPLITTTDQPLSSSSPQFIKNECPPVVSDEPMEVIDAVEINPPPVLQQNDDHYQNPNYPLITIMNILEALTPRRNPESIDSERLELLGDSFLKYLLTIAVFLESPHSTEGQMTAARKALGSNLYLKDLSLHKNGLVHYLRILPLARGNEELLILPPGQSNSFQLMEQLTELLSFYPYQPGIEEIITKTKEIELKRFSLQQQQLMQKSAQSTMNNPAVKEIINQETKEGEILQTAEEGISEMIIAAEEEEKEAEIFDEFFAFREIFRLAEKYSFPSSYSSSLELEEESAINEEEAIIKKKLLSLPRWGCTLRNTNIFLHFHMIHPRLLALYPRPSDLPKNFFQSSCTTADHSHSNSRQYRIATVNTKSIADIVESFIAIPILQDHHEDFGFHLCRALHILPPFVNIPYRRLISPATAVVGPLIIEDPSYRDFIVSTFQSLETLQQLQRQQQQGQTEAISRNEIGIEFLKDLPASSSSSSSSSLYLSKETINQIEKKLSYCFKDKELLICALTHPSKHFKLNYQRLEFLGDAILDYLLIRYLFQISSEDNSHSPQQEQDHHDGEDHSTKKIAKRLIWDEGKLTRLKGLFTTNDILCAINKELSLYYYISYDSLDISMKLLKLHEECQALKKQKKMMNKKFSSNEQSIKDHLDDSRKIMMMKSEELGEEEEEPEEFNKIDFFQLIMKNMEYRKRMIKLNQKMKKQEEQSFSLLNLIPAVKDMSINSEKTATGAMLEEGEESEDQFIQIIPDPSTLLQTPRISSDEDEAIPPPELLDDEMPSSIRSDAPQHPGVLLNYKFLADIVEAIIGAIFVDSSYNLQTVKDVLTYLGFFDLTKDQLQSLLDNHVV